MAQTRSLSSALRSSKQILKYPEWTFIGKSTTEYTHAMHLYPARMHPEIPRRLISKYAKDKNHVVLDPFMGSGGVLLEAILYGNNAIGIDVNPLAILLSKVKTTPINKDLHKTLNNIIRKSTSDIANSKFYYENIPKNLDVSTWYTSKVLNTLTIIKHHVFKIRDPDVRDFFKICFSLTLRKASYQRNGSWKIHRISKQERKIFEPPTLQIFENVSSKSIRCMLDLNNAKPKGHAYPMSGDSRNITKTFSTFNHKILEDKKAHLVVTSPPYGDHRTTVAYGQFSLHPGLWLELEHVLHVDKSGLGGANHDFSDLGSDALNTTLDKVQKNDKKLTVNKKPYRTKEVYSFFYDLDQCMKEISLNLIPNKSHCCFVIANRTVRRVQIPTDQIVVDLGTKYGFKVTSLIPRNIPNKVMPMRNAPENIPQNTCETMTSEMVIIMRY